MNVMKKSLLVLTGLLISGTMLAQNGGTIMKKYENQLPQEGRRNVHVTYQRKAIDQIIYEFMEEQGVDLTNLRRRIAAAFDDSTMGTGTNDNLLYTYESQFSVTETMARIEGTLETMGIPVFAKFDHGKNAEEAGLKLLPNQVIVFGSPKVGTKLMQDNPRISIELPLKISVWEDKDGSVWASFPQMKPMAAAYGLEGEPVIGKMQDLLEKIVIQSAGIY